MARTPTGSEVLSKAKEAMRQARSAAEVKQALTVILPLEARLSIHKTAQILDVSPAWACQMRRRFIRGNEADGGMQSRGGRRRQLMSLAEEQAFFQGQRAGLAPGQRPDYRQLQALLEHRLGRPVAMSTIYAMWRRHAA